MRWGSADPFVGYNNWDNRMGRSIANEGFILALLTHGQFDRYDFFCVDTHHRQILLQKLAQLIPDPALLSRVFAYLQTDLVTSIRSNDYDVFHFGDFTSMLPVMVQIRNQYAPRPFPITGITHSLDGSVMTDRYLRLVRTDLAPYDAIVCTSQCAVDSVSSGLRWAQGQLKLEDNHRVRMEKIPLAIEESIFQRADREKSRQHFRISPDEVVALCVGRIDFRQKADLAPILETFSRMRISGNIDNLRVIVAGGAEQQEVDLFNQMIKQLRLQDTVTLMPNFDPSLKTALYAAADFYFSMVDNYQETFGLSVVEAMASGLPVVCSDFNGYRELIRDNETGFLISTYGLAKTPSFIQAAEGVLQPPVMRLFHSQMVAVDLGEMAEAFLKLIHNGNLRKKMGETTIKDAQKYRWKNIIQQYELLWNELKQVAHTERWTPGCQSELFMDSSIAFAPHVSERLNPQTNFLTTDVGRVLMEKGNSVIRYEDVSECLRPDLEKWLLQTCQKARSLSGLLALAAQAFPHKEPTLEFHLIWLLKHGALSRAN